VGVRERRPGEFVNHPHRGADEPFDHPAEMGLARRPVVPRDAILLATPPQRLAVELRGIVQMDRTGLARHRPIGLDPEPFQPRPLVRDGVRQAEPHGGGRRGFQGHDHPHDTATEDVDGEGEVGTSDGLPRRFIDHDQVDGGMIDLDEVERPLGLWGRAGGRFQGACGLVPLPPTCHHHRVQPLDPGPDRVPCRWPDTSLATAPGDLAGESRLRTLGAREIEVLKRRAQDRFDGRVQACPALAAVGPARGEVGDQAVAASESLHEGVDLTAGQAELGGGLVRGVLIDGGHGGKRCDHPGPPLSLRPRLLGEGQDAVFGDRGLVTGHGRSAP
jgi:hypothetical protein